jgi:hypothetical protein
VFGLLHRLLCRPAQFTNRTGSWSNISLKRLLTRLIFSVFDMLGDASMLAVFFEGDFFGVCSGEPLFYEIAIVTNETNEECNNIA